jgi:hypothetical protein
VLQPAVDKALLIGEGLIGIADEAMTIGIVIDSWWKGRIIVGQGRDRGISQSSRLGAISSPIPSGDVGPLRDLGSDTSDRL